MAESPSASPLDGAYPHLLAEHSAYEDYGRELRRQDAERHLEAMAAGESAIREQQRIASQVTDDLQRYGDDFQARMEYVLEFGIAPENRAVFQEILKEVRYHGGLTLREAAALTHAKVEAANQSSKADAESESSSPRLLLD